MFEIFQYDIMMRALMAGVIVGIIAPMMGTYIVLRRLSMIGDTLAHVALAGVAGAAMAAINPIIGALVFTSGAALGIEGLKKIFHRYAELTLAILSATGIGLATVLISVSNNSMGINNYLFGAIALTSTTDLYIILSVGVLVILSLIVFHHNLFYITFDEEGARIAGIKVGLLNVYFIFLVALTIAVSMRIVGTLLISSMMTIPVAASMQLSKGFKGTMIGGVIIGVISVYIGLVVSFNMNLAPGGTIILTAVAMLIICILINSIRRAFRNKNVKKNNI